MRTFDENARRTLADFLIRIIEEENLSGADVAKQLSCKTVHVSWIKNPSYWKVVSQKVWDKLYDWKELEEAIKKTKPKQMEEKIEYEVEKDIPIPVHIPKGSRYPFSKMEVGDSFKVPYAKNVGSTISGGAGHFRRVHPEYKFVIRTLKEEGIVRCWRVK